MSFINSDFADISEIEGAFLPFLANLTIKKTEK